MLQYSDMMETKADGEKMQPDEDAAQQDDGAATAKVEEYTSDGEDAADGY